jgi:hypothetical protein
MATSPAMVGFLIFFAWSFQAKAASLHLHDHSAIFLEINI